MLNNWLWWLGWVLLALTVARGIRTIGTWRALGWRHRLAELMILVGCSGFSYGILFPHTDWHIWGGSIAVVALLLLDDESWKPERFPTFYRWFFRRQNQVSNAEIATDKK